MLVYVSPNRSNIMYCLNSFTNIQDTFGRFSEELLVKHCDLPHIIIYCRNYKDCYSLYQFFKAGLKKAFTVPIDAPDLAKFRLVDMYTSCTDNTTKSTIMEQFTKPSQLRIVIATIAFGMGVDCPSVHQIIHLGPPDDLESYIQETGHAGRDCNTAYATLLKTKRCMRYVDKNMKRYIENNTRCRRQLLFSEEEDLVDLSKNLCTCCDICNK